MTLGHQHGRRLLARTQTSTQPFVVTGVKHIYLDPSCSRAMDPDIGLSCSSVQDVPMHWVASQTIQIGMVMVVTERSVTYMDIGGSPDTEHHSGLWCYQGPWM